MRKARISVAASLWAALFTCPTMAEQSAGELIQSGKDPYFQVYMAGLLGGFGWSNLERKEGRLYCQPEDMEMQPSQALAILKRFVAKDPLADAMPAGLMMLKALAEAYPCPAGRRSN